MNFLKDPVFRNALIAAISLGATCSVLSVFVVLRRWAFIGEGIAHSGLAGAGTVWLLALLFPIFDHPAAPYAGIIIACLTTAMLIGYFSRVNRLNADAAIGIFLVASVAWGFMARSIYISVRRQSPSGWDQFLLGELVGLSSTYALAAAATCICVLALIVLLNKEIVMYCFDPVAAEVSGIRAALIHYLLMSLIAISIIVGIRIAGSLLATALLILPGATANLIATRFRSVVFASVAFGLMGSIAGVVITSHFRQIPAGPAIVLVLFVAFLLVFAITKLRRLA